MVNTVSRVLQRIHQIKMHPTTPQRLQTALLFGPRLPSGTREHLFGFQCGRLDRNPSIKCVTGNNLWFEQLEFLQHLSLRSAIISFWHYRAHSADSSWLGAQTSFWRPVKCETDAPCTVGLKQKTFWPTATDYWTTQLAKKIAWQNVRTLPSG